MRKISIIILSICFIALVVASAEARDTAKGGTHIQSPWSRLDVSESPDPEAMNAYESAATDTYMLVWYTFEQNNWQGWTRSDLTAQRGTYFHVDDFAGLGGGTFGRLIPISGTKSMWCGVRANSGDPYLCGWLTAPGYGNNWEQMLTTNAFSFIGSITLSYKGVFDSEPLFDYTYVEYDAGGGNWEAVATYDGIVDTVAVDQIAIPQVRTKLRFHFSADGGFSDEDGNYDSDGGAIIDDIRIADASGSLNYETFESVPVNATDAGWWHGRPIAGFGLYSGLKANLADKDPCNDNYSTQLAFFVGSPNPSSSYPGLYDTPFCAGPGGIDAPCQNEVVYSPVIDMTKYSTNRNNVQNATIPTGDLPLLGGCRIEFSVYRDLEVPNLVFYEWYVRTVDNAGCPGIWTNRNQVHYGEQRDFLQHREIVGDLLTTSKMQVAVGIHDMCDAWYLVYGNCAAHTPSPWIDNVRVVRWKTSGPQWNYFDYNLFQDNFPGDEFDLESYVRADAANDINANNNPIIRPGDSITVECSSPLGGGLATVGGLPAIYLHVKASYIGNDHGKPAQLAGAALQGSYGSYVSDNGTWTVIQGDTAIVAGQNIDGTYMFDLNDSLFTRGYMVEYYFRALDVAGGESMLPRYASARGRSFEFTCLPTLNSDVLFVDDFHGRGTALTGFVEDYWVPVFRAVLPANNQPDRFDVNGSDSGVSNGLGSRAKQKQLVDNYSTVVWDSGDLSVITISDGTVNSDKSNDCQLLLDWITTSTHQCGLWVCGDDVANDLENLGSAPATALLKNWCGVDPVANSYFELSGGLTGGGVTVPLVEGDPDAGIFLHGSPGAADEFYVYGGCNVINQFDVLDKTANGRYALAYPPYGGLDYYAGIASLSTNPASQNIRTMWFGFSYMWVRDDAPTPPIDRFEIAKDVFAWMQQTTKDPFTPAETPKVYALAQNFPNPFNPSTSIKFDMKEKGLVTLRVYNVAGQLVRTLVNEERYAGSYTEPWNGLNDRGTAVASGIYFYKMETTGFTATKKMVMLR